MTELAVHLTGPAAGAALAKRDITTVYRAGLQTASQLVDLAKGLRSVSVLKPLQEAAAARKDSACRDLAHELATLRSAA
ncbi:MAG: hypothetical protein ACRDTE_05240 [Pseudonocardiaceae bacterium]